MLRYGFLEKGISMLEKSKFFFPSLFILSLISFLWLSIREEVYFCIFSFNANFLIKINLSDCSIQFSTFWSQSCDQDQLFSDRDMIIISKSVFRKQIFHIMGIGFDFIFFPYSVSEFLEMCFKGKYHIIHIFYVD